MSPEAASILSAAGNVLSLAAGRDHPVYEVRNRTIYEIIGDFLQDYLPYIGPAVRDEDLESWLEEIMREGRMLDPAMLNDNLYIRSVQIHPQKKGKYILTDAAYEAGEILLYDMPEIRDGRIIPRLGCFSERTCFPTLLENGIPWMSVIPSEICSMQKDLESVCGDVLVLGLGLGYFAMMAAAKPEVRTVTVIEKSPEIIALFQEEILPCFSSAYQKKTVIYREDAFVYLETMQQKYDFCYCDLWFSQNDGQGLYRRLKEKEICFPETHFLYWIEEFLK